MLLLPTEQLAARRAAAAGPLKPLADSLAADLEPALSRDIYVPTEKALMSKAGGRCEEDGTLLEFDPFSPDEHGCATCGRTYSGPLHHRWWIYPYQLWLAERAVHAALLHLLRGDERHGRFARDVLRRYSAQYAQYPNRDNVLGPTRVFFSTYLESIWLLQLCATIDLLAAAGDHGAGDEACERIVVPSAALIAQYDEEMSNRQVWNNAALMAAALTLGDRAAAERVIHAPFGVQKHLERGLLADGTWYEGDNYHLFAHRGLWYGVAMAETAGMEIEPRLTARFQEGFATPFAAALPDFTFPSRKDSQYAVSLRQWRFADLCELGLARSNDRRLTGALACIYDESAPRGDTGRSRSSAEAERNTPSVRLTRADLGWRSLLVACPELPALEPATPRSAHFTAQGFTTFRREAGDVYVSLDWGQSGGGHGHPDRLNVMFAHGNTRWLDDLGTGSYVDTSLHWYRSTLAHNAPMVNGHSQPQARGRLLAHDERGGFGWILAESFIGGRTMVRRALIVTPDYFVDELRWTSAQPARFELPIHFDGQIRGVTMAPDSLQGGDGLEDGFGFVRDVQSGLVAAGHAVTLHAERDGHTARAWVCSDAETTWYRASAPGQPAGATRPFHVVRSNGDEGVIRSVWAWSPRVTGVQFIGDHIDVSLGGERHEHWMTPEYWQAELSVGGAHSGIELFGWVTPEEPQIVYGSYNPGPTAPSKTFEVHLGGEHYRRSEDTWEEAGKPTATVRVVREANDLVFTVSVQTPEIVFVDADATNPYDNEHPDINAHGVQLYLTVNQDAGGWVIVPERDSAAVRVRPLAGWGTLAISDARWARRPDGFEIHVRVPNLRGVHGSALGVLFDVIVNETAPGRERRRGQLVMSGAHNDFVYLRGDRHDHRHLVHGWFNKDA